MSYVVVLLLLAISNFTNVIFHQFQKTPKQTKHLLKCRDTIAFKSPVMTGGQGFILKHKYPLRFLILPAVT